MNEYMITENKTEHDSVLKNFDYFNSRNLCLFIF